MRLVKVIILISLTVYVAGCASHYDTDKEGIPTIRGKNFTPKRGTPSQGRPSLGAK